MSSHSPAALDRRSRDYRDRSDEKRAWRRSRSQRAHRHHHHHSSSHKHTPKAPLPLRAMPLSKSDYERYKPMFGLYLDVQKQIWLEDLAEEEAKGRWKSFVGKWNRGELAEGWYDPATLQKAQASATANDGPSASNQSRHAPPSRPPPTHKDKIEAEAGESSGNDEVGPTLPGREVQHRGSGRRPGPAIPSTQDLAWRKETEQEDHEISREDLRYDRKTDRKKQKERLDELVPRAEVGSKDRMLEKKREKADSNRAFASAKTEAGGVEEVPESDLLGDEDGGLDGFKKLKKQEERKKNERELRKEEILRARKEERDERVRDYQAKEERTMSGLVALARARFG